MNNGRAGDAKQARGVAFFDTTRTGFREPGAPRFIIRRENAQFYLVPCSGHNYGLIGLKPARCKESVARTGFVNPLSRRDAADGRFKANPSGGGQEAAGFVARRQRMHHTQSSSLRAHNPLALRQPVIMTGTGH